MHDKAVYFAHGKESGPWGKKITRLAEIARSHGFHVESPDYSGMDDPEKRIEKLLALKPMAKKLVLVGSSMGGYVSTIVSETLKPQGLFLLAPAYFLEGYGSRDLNPTSNYTVAIHGWNDEIIPAENVIKVAQKHKIQLILLAAEHSLISILPLIEDYFVSFLEQIEKQNES